MTVASPTQLPGFNESLRLLVERERYSLVDIALMFGVTRERARQWIVSRKINYPADTPRGLHATRVWNDKLNRFEPVATSVIRRARISRNRTQRIIDSRTLADSRVQQIKAVIAELSASLGRTPTWSELATAADLKHIGPSAACITPLNYCCSGAHSSSNKLIAFCHMTGYVPRESGGPGHVTKRDRTQCTQGHTYKDVRTRYCPICRKARDLRRSSHV